MKLRLAFLAALAVSSSAASATTFQELDRNADGLISKNETSAIPGYEAAFGEADENRDGRLNPDEFFKAESIHERQQAGKYVGDSVLTAKVKAALLRERGLKSRDLHVETNQGRVLLSGFVDTEEQKKRAVAIASSIGGVRQVRDGINLR
ncbi:MAG: BON domain-containing protein [Burkholderiales bacterium]